ncbi:MAG TPA: cytochrome P450 [Longimicrobium sp.]
MLAIPGPRPLPLVGWRGNLLAFMRDPPAHLHRMWREHGEIAAVARGSADYLFVFSPELNRRVLGEPALFHTLDASSSPLRVREGSALARLFDGLIQMNGDRHRQARRLVAPALHRQRIEAYHAAMAAASHEALAGWRAGERRDVWRDMRALTLSIAVRTFIGLDPAAGGDAAARLLERWMETVFSLPAVFLPFNVPGTPYHRLLSLSGRLDAEIRAMVAKRRAAGCEGGDVLSLLMKARDADGVGLTDDELIGQTNFLFMAGHATTASALTWTLLLLSQHPHVLGEVMDEMGSAGEVPSLAELAALPLLDAVLHESMRLLPPVTWSARSAAEPAELAGYPVPQGARVIFSAFVTHRLPEIYPQPARFNPARWLDRRPDAYEYLPFSAGPRACLGASFAMLEMKLVLALILRRFHLSPPPGTTVDPGGMMLLSPRRGLPMDVAARDGRLTAPRVEGRIHQFVEM